jgi:hypothetical protein
MLIHGNGLLLKTINTKDQIDNSFGGVLFYHNNGERLFDTQLHSRVGL